MRRAVVPQAYYTIRELSNHAEELWVLRALGDEILRSGPGGDGDPWLREHLARDYLGCWHNPIEGMHDGYDAALCNKGLSRWANYCERGLSTLPATNARLSSNRSSAEPWKQLLPLTLRAPSHGVQMSRGLWSCCVVQRASKILTSTACTTTASTLAWRRYAA